MANDTNETNLFTPYVVEVTKPTDDEVGEYEVICSGCASSCGYGNTPVEATENAHEWGVRLVTDLTGTETLRCADCR